MMVKMCKLMNEIHDFLLITNKTMLNLIYIMLSLLNYRWRILLGTNICNQKEKILKRKKVICILLKSYLIVSILTTRGQHWPPEGDLSVVL